MRIERGAMAPGGLSGRRLTLEQADYQGCATLSRPTLHFFWPLILRHLQPRKPLRPCTIVARFPKGAGYEPTDRAGWENSKCADISTVHQRKGS